MSQYIRIRRAWRLVPLAVVVLVVAAAPAAAKGPLIVPPGCPLPVAKAAPPQDVPAHCPTAATANRGTQAGGADAALIAGGVAVAILIVGGATLIARRGEVDDPRRAALT